jgi:hypothetical protein
MDTSSCQNNKNALNATKAVRHVMDIKVTNACIAMRIHSSKMVNVFHKVNVESIQHQRKMWDA